MRGDQVLAQLLNDPSARTGSPVDWSLTTVRDRALDDRIAAYARDGDRILDLGCGAGDLLVKIKQRTRISEMGVEFDGTLVQEAIAKGLSVVHGDLEDGLSHLADGSFDMIILNQVITVIRDPVALLEESLRVGHRVAVTFPNFAGWRTRCQLFFRGRLPVTPSLPYQWYDTPNIRLVTVKDFRNLVRTMGLSIMDEYFVSLVGRRARDRSFRPVARWPNLLASSALFLVRR